MAACLFRIRMQKHRVRSLCVFQSWSPLFKNRGLFFFYQFFFSHIFLCCFKKKRAQNGVFIRSTEKIWTGDPCILKNHLCIRCQNDDRLHMDVPRDDSMPRTLKGGQLLGGDRFRTAVNICLRCHGLVRICQQV